MPDFIDLARTLVHDTELPLPTGSTPPGGDETILLVEDEVAVRRVTARMLTRLGYHVLEAEHGAQALDVARAEPCAIDLLLTDVLMPEMDGVTLAKHMQGLRTGIRVLYMSGYAADLMTPQTSGQAETPLVEKPFAWETMARAIRQALA